MKTLDEDTVTDKFNRGLRDLRVSVTDRCNFRCPYCMPAEIFGERYQFLPRADLLTFEEIVRVVTASVRLGVRKIRLTGGSRPRSATVVIRQIPKSWIVKSHHI